MDKIEQSEMHKALTLARQFMQKHARSVRNGELQKLDQKQIADFMDYMADVITELMRTEETNAVLEQQIRDLEQANKALAQKLARIETPSRTH